MGSEKSIEDKILYFKKELEAIPELAWNEIKTKEFIIQSLGKNYIWSEKTAIIYKLGSGKAIFFRADMDALNTPLDIRHVCGHSTHMASLMSAYLYFQQNPPQNTIYFIFQPSEEGSPSGAEFVTQHFLKKNTVIAGFGFHVWENLKMNALYDVHMASGDYFEISISGNSTHIKNKNDSYDNDVLTIASKLIQKINTKRFSQSVINVGTMKGGETPNSIAGNAILTGDIRAWSERDRVKTYKWLLNLSQKIQGEQNQVKIFLKYSKIYPFLKNDKKLLKKVQKILPINGKITSFGTEDFALYPKPFVFLFVGTGNKKGIHEVDFLVSDETAKKLFTYWITLGTKLTF